MSTLYVIDGHAQFFRAYHAIRTGMRSPVTNEPTNMTFGFVGVLLKLLRERKPDYLAVVIDASGDRGTFRSQIYPEYKANRSAPPEDLEPQVERCVGLLRELGIPVLAVEGVEADDTIAAVVTRMRREHPDLEIRIVSRDKDLGQLVDSHTRLFDPQTDRELGVEELFETKGVRPDQVVDMLALMGDPVDNVPGVRGVGLKTAARLISEHGSLAALLDNLASVKGKVGEAIAAQRDVLPLSRRLVELRADVPVPFDLEAARLDLRRVDPGPPLETLRQLGFHRLTDEVRRLLGAPAGVAAGDAPTAAEAPSAAPPVPPARGAGARARAPAAAEAPEFDLFSAPSEQDAAAVEAPRIGGEAVRLYEAGQYRLIRGAAELRAAIEELRGAVAEGALLAFDTETTGLNPVSAGLCGISLSARPHHALYIPVRSPEPAAHLGQEEAVAILRPLMEDASIPKTAHNAKFDLVVLRAAGIRVRGLAGDTMVASYVLDATRGSHGMNGLSEAFLGRQCIPIAALIGTGRHQRSFDQVALELAAPYAAEDADVALQLEGAIVPRLEESGLGPLYRDVELPLVEVLAELEWNGIRVDGDELERQRRALEGEIARLRTRIEAAAPRPFNPDSPRQLAEILFNEPGQQPSGLGLKVVKRTRTGASTDVEVLERLAQDPAVTTELPALILEHRQLTKLVGTYLVALREAVNPSTGRIHASFHQTVAATGRLSSSDPNLQNIPIRTAVGREIRRAFVADDGNAILSADYSQIELRILAHLSGDAGLIAAFQGGADIHAAVAAEVYGIRPEDVTPEQRGAAKMVNFGIVYGITPFGLARRLGSGTSTERARQIIEDYRRRFSGIDAFLAACVEHARVHGHVATILGRRRAVPQIHSRNPAERALGERIAINTVVQGSAADLIKLAMLAIHRALPTACPAARMLLQIHDELVFEVPEAQVGALDAFVRREMEGAMALRVPLKVETGWAPNWFDA